MKKSTLLCIDLKTYLQTDPILKPGKTYCGELQHDGEYHLCFMEQAPSCSAMRNMRVFDGNYINVTRRPIDGNLRINTKALHIGPSFDIDAYAIGFMNELRQALHGLVER